MSTVINEYVNSYYLMELGPFFTTEYELQHSHPSLFRGKIRFIDEQEFNDFSFNSFLPTMIDISLDTSGWLKITWTERPKLHFLCVTYNFGKPIDSIVRNTNWLQEGF